MTTRYDVNKEAAPGRLSQGYETGVTPTESLVPSCGPEDVDRAFFEFFNSKLPLFYTSSKESGEMRRVPIVFASGERFALAAKQRPLMDKNGALILPMIAITRSGISLENTKGNVMLDRSPEVVIKKRISEDDPLYQALQGTDGLENTGTAPQTRNDFSFSTGRNLDPKMKKGIYEITVIPGPKYFTVKYEINIWAQYVQQLNDIIQAILGSFPFTGRSVKVKSSKGYWFVAFFGEDVAMDNNLADFTDNERLIKANMTAEVPGYLVAPEFPGSPNGVRVYTSAPTITFDMTLSGVPPETHGGNVNSTNVDNHILTQIATEDNVGPLQSIGTSPVATNESIQGYGREGSAISLKDRPLNNFRTQTQEIEYTVDPITGEKKKIVARVTSHNLRKGEKTLISLNPDKVFR